MSFQEYPCGRGSRVVWVPDRDLPGHEFEPSTTKDPPYNKIDRHKTAKAIIAEDNIDIRDRFMLASHYCFQEDVFSIWKILDDAQQSFFQECDFNIARMWVNCERNGAELDWNKIARDNRFALQTYFPKLKREKRLQQLKSIRREIWNDYHELQFCLSIFDQNEQDEILKNCPFPILEVFLDWSV
ncbi:hypothetical protein TNCV_319931 [Trichonephila clavipes]|nr:hypothetical protein TNCV_319931 [Trichonephila clavipes]